MNPALVAMLGYSSAEEILKLSVAQDVFSDPEEGLCMLPKWQLTGKIEEEVQWKRRDQRLITVRLNGRVLCLLDGYFKREAAVLDPTLGRVGLENMIQVELLNSRGDRAISDTVPVDGCDTCSILYISENEPEQRCHYS